MSQLLENIIRYLEDVLGDRVDAHAWHASLPVYLEDRYAFYQLKLMGTGCLLMLERNKEGETPGVIRKHVDKVSKACNELVIYGAAELTSYNRKRLIEHRVAFVVPKKQLYAPMLAVDLREHFSSSKRERVKHMSALAQVLVLRSLLRKENNKVPTSVLAEEFGYSPMTASRAINELQELELAEVEKVGRSNYLHFVLSPKEVWEAAKHHMANPVRKRIRVEGSVDRIDAALEAGETALAHYSMLAEPKQQVIAIFDKKWVGIKQMLHLNEVQYPDYDTVEIELWRYNPSLIKHDRCVDQLSLWLSLRDNRDERVKMAMDDMLGEIQW